MKDAMKTVFAYCTFWCQFANKLNSGVKTTEKIIIDCDNCHKGNQHGNTIGNK